MSDTGIIALVVGVVAIALLVLYRTRLRSIAVDGRKRRINVSMDRSATAPEAGARQDGIDAAGNVTAHDKMGVGASQKNVRSGGDVSAIVDSPTGESAAKKG
jgi:hypothetical protein